MTAYTAPTVRSWETSRPRTGEWVDPPHQYVLPFWGLLHRGLIPVTPGRKWGAGPAPPPPLLRCSRATATIERTRAKERTMPQMTQACSPGLTAHDVTRQDRAGRDLSPPSRAAPSWRSWDPMAQAEHDPSISCAGSSAALRICAVWIVRPRRRGMAQWAWYVSPGVITSAGASVTSPSPQPVLALIPPLRQDGTPMSSARQSFCPRLGEAHPPPVVRDGGSTRRHWKRRQPRHPLPRQADHRFCFQARNEFHASSRSVAEDPDRPLHDLREAEKLIVTSSSWPRGQ